VRHLLNCTSGLPDSYPSGMNVRLDYTDEEILRGANREPLRSPPGERYHYSSLGYVVLGILVKHVGGKFYGDVLLERVFRPLGMDTAHVIDIRGIVPNRAAGYEIVDGVLVNQEYYSPTWQATADGALNLSVLDLAKWDAGLLAGKVLRPESWKEVFRPGTLAGGDPSPYGFGWAIEKSAVRSWCPTAATRRGCRRSSSAICATGSRSWSSPTSRTSTTRSRRWPGTSRDCAPRISRRAEEGS